MSAPSHLAPPGLYPPLHAPAPCAATRHDWLPLVGLVSVWVPAMIASSSVWGQGDLYGYGWVVPPAAVWLMARRWQKTQSFLMATWFFAELQRMTAARTLCLLGCACALAFMTNIGRIYYLAQIRFNQLNTLLALNSAR